MEPFLIECRISNKEIRTAEVVKNISAVLNSKFDILLFARNQYYLSFKNFMIAS